MPLICCRHLSGILRKSGLLIYPKKCDKIAFERGECMKYMTFNSSGVFTAVANMLEMKGVSCSDRDLAVGMLLPYLFREKDGVFESGTMLKDPSLFNRYLDTVGFMLSERRVEKNSVPGYIKNNIPSMMEIYPRGKKQGARVVVFTGEKDGKFAFLNCRSENSPEPDSFLMSRQELLDSLDEVSVISTVSECQPGSSAVYDASDIKASSAVLDSIYAKICAFCSEKHTVKQLRQNMDPLFRALLLEAVTMLELIGETELSGSFRVLQMELLYTAKQDETETVKDFLSMELLRESVMHYKEIISRKYREVHVAMKFAEAGKAPGRKKTEAENDGSSD